MATCNYIQAKKQTQSALKAVIKYVSQDAKTLDDRGHRYLTGINCLAPAAYDEFMATKNIYSKRGGIMYYHYEQSFAPGEIEDYETAHEIGLKLAKEMFTGFEVLVGTHLDAYDGDGKQRVHNHFVINSVSIDTGLKMDYGPRTLQKMRKISDRLCKEKGLSVLPQYEQQFITKGLNTREYRAALRGKSWKFRIIYDIEEAMKHARTKAEFVSMMENQGYSIVWTDNRKYITYTCPNGMKIRDNKLHEIKFLKENMEYEFTIRQQIKQYGSSEAQANDGRNDADDQRNTVSANNIRNPEGGLESISGIHEDDIRIPADAFLEASGFGKVHSDKNGLEHLDARSQRMGECGWGSSGGNVQLYSGQDAEDPHGKPRTSYTGWEDSRHFLLESASGGEWTDWRNDAFEYPNEEMDSDNTSLKYGADIRVEYGDLSVDEMNSFFEEENNEDDKDIDTEYTLEQIEHLLNAEHEGSAYASYLLGRIYMCGNIVAKNLSEAIHHFEISSRRGYSYADYRLGRIYLFEPDYFDMDAALEHLNRSAQMGNEYAAIALQRIAENSFLAITTNVLDLIKGLSSIEYREPIKDCTTLPQRRAKKKWEQTM